MRLGYEATDGDRAADVLRAGRLPARLDHLVRQPGDLQHVLVGLGGQPAHEVELHVPPAIGVRGDHGADQVLLRHHLVDHPADPLRAALRGEGQPGTPAVAGQLPGERHVERVDPGGRQGERDVRALVPVGQALGDVADLRVVGAGQREQSDLGEPGEGQALLHHVADRGDGPLAYRPGDHAGLAEPAAPGAAAEDLHRVPLVHRLGERHQRLLRVRPGVQIHRGPLVHPERHARAVRADLLDPPVGQVVHVVEARHVDALGAGEPQQQLVPAARSAGGLPVPHDRGDLQYRLLPVAEHGGVDEVGDRLRVERGVPTGDHHRVRLVPLCGLQRNAGQVQRGEQVGVPQLGGERHTKQVERADRAVGVHGELRYAVLAHQPLQVGPDRVGALGQHVGQLVEHLVQDLHALVGQAHLVGVGVHQRPAHGGRVPVLHHRAQFAAHVLDGLADQGQQRLQLGPDTRRGDDTHNEPGYAGASARPAVTPARAGWSDDLHRDGRGIARVEALRGTHDSLDRQHVPAPSAVREDRRPPGAAADRGLDPHRAESATRSTDQVTNLLGRLDGQADEEPAVGPPGVPPPQLGIEHDHHGRSIPRRSDNRRVPHVIGEPPSARQCRVTRTERAGPGWPACGQALASVPA